MAIATTKMIENVIAGTTLVKIAQKANQDGNGANIVETYAKQNGNYPNMAVGNSTNADNASAASVINNVVDLTGQAAGSITFSCASIPAASVSGRVIILN